MSALIIPNALIVEATYRTVKFQYAKEFQTPVDVIRDRAITRHGGFVRLGLDAPKKPRTLLSSRKLHGMIGQLAQILVL